MNTPPNEPADRRTGGPARTSAGQPICVEGHERVSDRPPETVPSAQDGNRRHLRPSAEDLAGVPICVEGREDLRVRRISRRPDAAAAPGDG